MEFIPAWLALTLLTTEWALRIGLAIRVMTSRRAVPTSLAWIAVLLMAPVVGIFVYLLIGENRLGSRRAARHRSAVDTLSAEAAARWRAGDHDWTDECLPYKPIATLASHVGLLPPLRGNSIEIIGDSKVFIDRLVADIDAATTRVHILTYIWMTRGAGVAVGEALVRAVKRGVTCRVLADGVGSRPFFKSPLHQRMRRAGVEVYPALPVNPIRALFARIDLRNHRKIATIDGRIAYTGSQNIADTSFKFSPKSGVGPWVDASVRVVGPAAQALEVVFLHDWLIDTPASEINLDEIMVEMDFPGNGSTVHVVPSMPGRDLNAVYEAVVAAIYMAREEIILTTPYFVPDASMWSALRAACLRGVQLSIVLPAINDSPLVGAASRASYQYLLEVGAEIHEFNKGLLHAKILTIDRHIGLIGSANFDVRSFWLNFEISLFIYDSDVASQLRFLQKHYMQDSTQVTAEVWSKRNVFRRMLEDTARLAGPLL
jgi:cardiolipin synthase